MKTSQGIYEVGTDFSFRKKRGEFKHTSFKRNNNALDDILAFQRLPTVYE